MERKNWKYLLSLTWLITFLSASNTVQARTWYNFPSYAKVKVTRDTSKQSWLYLEFMWDNSCPPNFEPGIAVEFEFGITPKCFIQPKGGMDAKYKCNEVLGPYHVGFNLPNNYIPTIDANNCYVDLWNYWNPAPDEVVKELHETCEFDSSGNQCAWWATALGVFLDPIGNFAVGLHDASALKAGERYFFRYPVEINDSPDCVSLPLIIEQNPTKQCHNGETSILSDTIWEDPGVGYITKSVLGVTRNVHNDWGRVQITMQSFKNSCDLADACDRVTKEYTCPHLIGASASGSGCQNANKHTDFWLSRLCAPTGDYEFTPGFGTVVNNGGKCVTEATSSDLDSHGVCCLDMDNDKYFGATGYNVLNNFTPVSVFGTNVGDCNDNNYNINPSVMELNNDNIDSNCDGCDNKMCVAGSDPPGSTCPSDGQCTPGQQAKVLCSDGVHSESMICNDECKWETTETCPATGAVCTPNQVETQACAVNGQYGNQTRTCNANGQWDPWSSCVLNCQCQSGACCNGCNYYANGTYCNGYEQFQCSGSGAGSDVLRQVINQYCSGYSAACDGSVSQSGWSVYQDCSGSQSCQMNGSTASCVPITACTDTYTASSSNACLINSGKPGTPTLCLKLQQVSGSSWKFQVCLQSGTFPQDFSLKPVDENHTSQNLGGPWANTSGNSCSQWHDFSVAYIPGYGAINGAGIKAELVWPLGGSTTYYSGTSTILKECK